MGGQREMKKISLPYILPCIFYIVWLMSLCPLKLCILILAMDAEMLKVRYLAGLRSIWRWIAQLVGRFSNSLQRARWRGRDDDKKKNVTLTHQQVMH